MDPRSILIEAKRKWQPPPELQRSSPREVRQRAAGRTLLVLAALFVLGAPVAGLLLHARASADHAQRRELMSRGVNARAVVTRRWMRRGDHPRYLADYIYEAGGRTLTGRVDISRSSWERLEQGSVLPVRYLPADPRQHLVPGYEGDLMPLWLPYAVAGAMAAAGWLLTLPLKSERRLLTEGRPAPGVVLAHRKVQQTTTVRYAFVTLSGAIAEGKMQAQKNPPAIGSLLTVVYEPDNAGNNRAYPFSLYRCED